MDSPQAVILFCFGRSSIGVAEFLLDFPFIRSYNSVSECEVAALAAPRGERFTERLRVRHTGNAISQQPRSVNVSNGAHLASRFIFGRLFRPRGVRPKSDAAGRFRYSSPEELAAAGANDSLTHIDFMVGSPQLHIDGEAASGERVPVFRNGTWANS